MKALILAAGYGTRLYPITKHIPKPLLVVQGKPIVNHLIEKVHAVKDIDEVFVITNDKFYSSFKNWQVAAKEVFKGLSIKVINDGSTSPEDRKGAMGDVGFVVRERDVKDDLLVLGGDNLFDESLEKFVKFSLSENRKATIGLFDINDKKHASKFGVVDLDGDGRLVYFEEKPKSPKSSLIAMCLYYFSAESLELIFKYLKETSHHDTTGDFINWLHKKIPVYGFIFKGRWDDIGHIDSLCSWEEDYCKFKEGRIEK